jgi:hypothetical protein
MLLSIARSIRRLVPERKRVLHDTTAGVTLEGDAAQEGREGANGK